MYYQHDEQFNLDCFRDLINTPSPVGYDILMNPVLERYAAMFGCQVTYDNKGTAYITIDGHDNSKTVMVSTHLDTLGLVVRRIEPDHHPGPEYGRTELPQCRRRNCDDFHPQRQSLHRPADGDQPLHPCLR